MAEEISTLSGAEAGGHEAEEGETSEGTKDGVVVEICNQWSGKEKQDVEAQPYENIEPEDRVVLLMSGFPLISQCCRESAFLKDAGDIGEDDQRRHLTVVCRIEQIGEPDSEEGAEQLHHAIAESSPNEALGSPLLERPTFSLACPSLSNSVSVAQGGLTFSHPIDSFATRLGGERLACCVFLPHAQKIALYMVSVAPAFSAM